MNTLRVLNRLTDWAILLASAVTLLLSLAAACLCAPAPLSPDASGVWESDNGDRLCLHTSGHYEILWRQGEQEVGWWHQEGNVIHTRYCPATSFKELRVRITFIRRQGGWHEVHCSASEGSFAGILRLRRSNPLAR